MEGKYHLRILTYTILEMVSYLFGAYYSYITYIPFYPHVKMLEVFYSILCPFYVHSIPIISVYISVTIW